MGGEPARAGGLGTRRRANWKNLSGPGEGADRQRCRLFGLLLSFIVFLFNQTKQYRSEDTRHLVCFENVIDCGNVPLGLLMSAIQTGPSEGRQTALEPAVLLDMQSMHSSHSPQHHQCTIKPLVSKNRPKTLKVQVLLRDNI